MRVVGHKCELESVAYLRSAAKCKCGWRGPIRGSQERARGDYHYHLQEMEAKRKQALDDFEQSQRARAAASTNAKYVRTTIRRESRFLG